MNINRLILHFLVFLSLAGFKAMAQPGLAAGDPPFRQAQDTIKLLDSLYTYTWHKGLNSWVNYDLDLQYYDNNTDLVKWSRKHWDESYGYIWYDDFKVVYTLQNRLTTEELKQDYLLETKEWINATLFTYQYDGNRNRIEWKWQQWSDTKSDWVNFRLNQYTYTDADQLLQSISQIWDNDSSAWVPSQRIDHFYDDTGYDTLEMTYRWSAGTSDWINLSRKASTYDATGTPVEVLIQYWDTNTGKWLNSSRSITYFDPENNLIRTILQHWDNDYDLWKDKNQSVNYYNAEGLVGSFITSQWDMASQMWANVSGGQYEYDKDGDKTSAIFQYWNDDREWENSTRMRYVYRRVLDIQEATPGEMISCRLLSSFPGNICLTCNGFNGNERYLIRLLSLQGNSVSSWSHSGDPTIPLDDPMETGIYMLTIHHSNVLVYSKKIFIP